MKYLVLGAGLQSRAIVHYLLGCDDTAHVHVIDAQSEAVEALSRRFQDERLSCSQLDVVCDLRRTQMRFRDCDVIVSAVPYDLNFKLTKLAVHVGGKHFVDLGGNNDVEAKQVALSDRAAERGVAIAPAQGIAPGAVSVLVAHLMKVMGGDTFDSVDIYVGGIPVSPLPPIGYSLYFSVHGLFNEYLESTEVLREGRREVVDSLTDVVPVTLASPFGTLEAALTSGGSSTLTRTFEGRVGRLEYRTLRWPGHWKVIQLLRHLGLLSMDPDDGVRGVTPREIIERSFAKNLPQGGDDAIVVRIDVRAGERLAQFDLTITSDEKTELSAMQRATGFSAAIVARMLATGEITKRGTLTTELDIPADKFLDEWKRCGFSWTVRQT